MKIVENKKAADSFLVELSRKEYLILIAGLRETDEQIGEAEFLERVGHSRDEVNVLLDTMHREWTGLVRGDIDLDEIKW